MSPDTQKTLEKAIRGLGSLEDCRDAQALPRDRWRQVEVSFSAQARRQFRHGSHVAFEKRDGTIAVGVVEKLNPTSAGVVIKDPATGQLLRYRVDYALLKPAEASPDSPHAQIVHVVTGRGVVTKTVVTP